VLLHDSIVVHRRRGKQLSDLEGELVTTPTRRRDLCVWLLLGHKAGDNTQVRALAAVLNWPTEERVLRYRPWELLTNRLLGATLLGVNRTTSDQLTPPWPDLVISSGRRNEPVARWIQRQSGGRTRLVHIGRPWADPARFDLIVSTPQYALPARENLLMNVLPMHRLSAQQLNAAADQWRSRFAALPGPLTTVLLGGNSGATIFTPAKAQRMGQQVNGLVRRQGGSVLVTDSARTPAKAFDAFMAQIEVPHHVHRWGSAAVENPYHAFLALADQFVVTADSMSMVSEAVTRLKPLYLFSLDDGPDWYQRAYNYAWTPLTHRLAMRYGPERMKRDVNRILNELIAQGRAIWLGDEFPMSNPLLPIEDGALHAAMRVAALFGPEARG